MKITINTGLFTLSFVWNGKTFGIHICILIGLIFSNYITRATSVHKLCLVFLLIDLMVILFLLLREFHVDIGEIDEAPPLEESKDKKPDAVPTKNMNVEVDHKKSTKKTKETNQVIKNKVAIPNPQPVQSTPTGQTASTSQPILTPTVEPELPKSTEDEVVSEMASKFTEGTMTEDDWNNLFDLG